MPQPRFLQIHSLHGYSAALLNRDDTGLSKRLPFGGTMRTRISSQCLKRHWRTTADPYRIHAIPGATEAVRSRDVVARRIIAPLRGEIADDVLDAVEAAFTKALYGDKAATSRQPLLFGQPEIAYLRDEAAAIAREHAGDAKAAAKAAEAFQKNAKANLKAMRENTALPGGLEAALFGRMVTADTEANIDAAIHVAHAFTVHAEEVENDYFTVVDDLRRDDEDAGAAHIGETELTSGLFYGYVVVDVPALVSNLTGEETQDWLKADRAMAGQVAKHLIHLIATVSPGAKLGSTAPYGYASAMLIEAGDRQPRSLANAFRDHVEANVEDATTRMAEHLGKLDACYGANETRRFMSVESVTLPGAERVDLPTLAVWAADCIQAAEAA